MENQQLANKITARIDYMIMQYLPRPTCANKQQAHAAQVREVKRLIAYGLAGNNGLNIEIKV